MNQPAATPRQVICMKWGTKFPAEDVNRLYRMVRRWVGGDLRFWCVTDHPEGIDPAIEVLALPAVPVVGDRLNRGWRKLGLFDPALGGPQGPTLFLDLDVVIVDTLAPLFEAPGDFRVIKDYKRFRYRHSFTGNTSVFRYNAGAHGDLYDELKALGPRVFEDYRNEQEFMSDFMRRKGLLQYWPKPWCVSYKYSCVRPLPFGLWQTPRLPDQARVLVFHGDPKPEDAVIGLGSKWYRVIRPAPWLTRYMELGPASQTPQ